MDEIEGRRKYPPKAGCIYMCMGPQNLEYWVYPAWDSVEVYDIQTGQRAPGDRMDWREVNES
jgi:hypothetical protein